MIVCKEIRLVEGGYIVEIRHPYGDGYPFGEAICKTFDEVVSLLGRAVEGIDKNSTTKPEGGR